VSECFGLQTATLKITCDKALKSVGTIWVNDGNSTFNIIVPNASSGVVSQISFAWQGDSIYGTNTEAKYISIVAVQGLKIGQARGVLQVIEDDSVPQVYVTKRSAVTEGSNLVWSFKLSTATAGMAINCLFIPPVNGTELTSADVPVSWLKTFYVDIPTNPTPLSEVGIYGVG
jgi:hypothetical protein